MNRLERQSYDMETLAPMDKDQIQKRQVPIQGFCCSQPSLRASPCIYFSNITKLQALTPFLTPHTYALTGG